MPHSKITDFLIIGAGVAGLRAALTLAEHGEVLVVTKEAMGESNTHYAQGGIAVAMEDEADVQRHLEDTIAAGDGLVHREAAEVLVGDGPRRVAELIEWGAAFDRRDGNLLRTREAAHSSPRIIHANGDATGAEISRSLIAIAKAHPRIRFAEWKMAESLVFDEIDGEERIVGADLIDANAVSGEAKKVATWRVSARAVLIATGGAGQVYSDTTNPAVATGDGIALAAAAGAQLADMEFYQFHPTAISLPGVPRFLLSEALRGEGAWLRNDLGERFMEKYHAQMELAPRDVVARAIAREGLGSEPSESRPVYLDMRHVREINLGERFPGISRFLAQHGLKLQNDLIPVRPAAHYLMGGIRTDLDGRTTLKGLYAAGEAACTGVHGANRLASNSLLEGLVFGERAAQAMLKDAPEAPSAMPPNYWESAPLSEELDGLLEKSIGQLRRSMWVNAGLLRDEDKLLAGIAISKDFDAALNEINDQGLSGRRYVEACSLGTVARAILRAALAREESRGAHFRNDYPRRNDAQFKKHSVDRNLAIRFEAW